MTEGVAVLGAGVAATPVLGNIKGTVQGGFTGERRSTYRALIDAVASSPGTLVDAERVLDATSELAKRYAEAPGWVREQIDQALDALEEVAGGSFASLSAADRLSRLREELLEHAPAEDLGGSVSQRIGDAVALAVGPFHPAGFRWDPGAADLWIRTLTASGLDASSQAQKDETQSVESPAQGTL